MVEVGVVGLGEMGQHHARIYSELSSPSVTDVNEPLIAQTSAVFIRDNSQTMTKRFSFDRRKSLQSLIKLVGVSDTNPERAKKIGEKYHIPYYPDYHDLLDKVEAVSIAVPTILHHNVAMDFLKEGVHCLVEKPISFNLHEAQEMIESAQKNHVNLAVGHIEQFNPAVVKLKEVIDQGALGKLLIISTRRVGPFVMRIHDVGVVIDSAIHDIGVIRHLMGKEPISVFSRVGHLKHSNGDYAVIVLDFGNTIACIEVNWFTSHKVRTLVATGSDGTAYLDYIQQNISVHNSHDNSLLLPAPNLKSQMGVSLQSNNQTTIRKTECLKLELEDFINSVVLGKKPSVDGIEGMAILRIALESCEDNLCHIS